jgi:hypothetical protein
MKRFTRIRMILLIMGCIIGFIGLLLLSLSFAISSWWFSNTPPPVLYVILTITHTHTPTKCEWMNEWVSEWVVMNEHYIAQINQSTENNEPICTSLHTQFDVESLLGGCPLSILDLFYCLFSCFCGLYVLIIASSYFTTTKWKTELRIYESFISIFFWYFKGILNFVKKNVFWSRALIVAVAICGFFHLVGIGTLAFHWTLWKQNPPPPSFSLSFFRFSFYSHSRLLWENKI